MLSRLLFSFALTTSLACAQIISSTILGEVTDPSGAVLPGAEVVATNTDTGIPVHIVTNTAGAFSFPNLLAGNYQLSISKTGFQTLLIRDIELLSSVTLRHNVQLKMGQTSDSVTVTDEAPLLQSASPTIASSLSDRQISELPLSIESITELLNLGPGAQTAWGANNPQTGGGTHWGSTNFAINGMTINDFGNGNGGSTLGISLMNVPSLGSLQEFKTDSVNMTAEYRAVGSVSMVTKQGSNRFHGQLFEYAQNAILSANTFTANRLGQDRAKLNRNQFGANVGGPILRNKAFFFADYSGFRQRTVTNPQLNVPTEAMRNGDFSAVCTAFDANGFCTRGTPLYDPYGGAPFARNQIPVSRITSQAKTLLGFYPVPNFPASSNFKAGLPNGTGNFIDTVLTTKDNNTFTVRGDYRISERDNLYAVVNRVVGNPWFEPQGTPKNYGNYGDAGHRVTGISLSENHVFAPNLLNDARIGWFDQAANRRGQNSDFDPLSLIPQLTPSPNRGLPTVSMTGYLGLGDKNNSPYSPQYTIQITDNLTWVRGRHTYKAGLDETGYKSYTRQGLAPLGSFGFTGAWTGGRGFPTITASQGNAFADFLLGTAATTSTGLVPYDQICYGRDWEVYVQDTWQATGRLTLYYGARYAYQKPWTLRDRTVTFYDPTTNQLALPEDSMVATLPTLASPELFSAYKFTTTKALGLPLDYIAGDKNNLAPRVGLAFRARRTTVIRLGYGIYYNFHPLFIGSRTDNNNPPWGGTGLTYSSKLPGKPTAPFLPDLTFSNPFPAEAKGSLAAANPTVYSLQQDLQMAAAQQWNATVEHGFTPNWKTRISYVGSKTDHLPFYLSDLNVPAAQIPNVPTQQQRPIQPWGSVFSTRSGGVQKMHQLQLELSRRMARGFMVQAQYQWTRSLDNVELTGQTNWHYPSMDYGNTSYIRRHQLVMNYIYEIPFGKGKKWLGHAHPLIEGALGGWQVSGITTYATSIPYSVNFVVPTTLIGWAGGRADTVPGAPVYVDHADSHDITKGVQWFNPAAFIAPTPWTYGNSSRNGYFGPGMYMWNASLFKSFRVPLGEQTRLQLRADFLNLPNHFNLGNPSASIADTRDGGTAVSTSGKVTGGSGNRNVQVGMRVTF